LEAERSLRVGEVFRHLAQSAEVPAVKGGCNPNISPRTRKLRDDGLVFAHGGCFAERNAYQPCDQGAGVRLVAEPVRGVLEKELSQNPSIADRACGNRGFAMHKDRKTPDAAEHTEKGAKDSSLGPE
jgi:hypothetical protein